MLFIIFVSYGPGSYTHSLQPGEYQFTINGARGGESDWLGTPNLGSGGTGTVMKGNFHTNKTVSLSLTVGQIGSKTSGGTPDGGGSSLCTSTTPRLTQQGGGGGSTTIKMGSTILMQASGGSGAGNKNGCKGGPVGYVYCGSSSGCTQVLQTVAGSRGGKGYTGYCSVNDGSIGGGGGGYYSGLKYNGYSCSGSSYISDTYIRNGDITGSTYSAGKIEITTLYLCDSSCSDCDSATTCISCKSSYFFYKKNCYKECPMGTYPSGDQCYDCSSNCATCVGSPSVCTSCPNNMKLYKSQCYDECPYGTYLNGNTCYDCSSSCATCVGSPSVCTSCPNNMKLYKSKCFDACPIATFENETGVCLDCGVNCTKCVSEEKCIKCIPGYAPCYNGTCVKLIRTRTWSRRRDIFSKFF